MWERDPEVLMRTFDSQPDKLTDAVDHLRPGRWKGRHRLAESGWNLDTYLLIWDVTGDQAPQKLGRGNRELRRHAFSEDGRTLATGWEDNRVRIWTVAAR